MPSVIKLAYLGLFGAGVPERFPYPPVSERNMVDRTGVEPVTPAFSVLCSTS